MDSGSDGGSFWQKLSRVFHLKNVDHVEQAIIEASQDGELHAAEGHMLLSVLRLDDLQVQDIMTPRTDITGVDGSAMLPEAIEAILASGHSRLPVYLDNRDNIVGVLYAKDLLRESITPSGLNKVVSTVMREPFFVPLTKNALELLNELRSRKIHMAVILDEYGGTSGLITIEDILEEIVGEIEDEHDTPKEEEINLLDGGSAEIAGRAYLVNVNKALGINLDSDEVDTIGGLLSHIAGCMPEQGQQFDLDAFRFTVQEADSKQVRKVLAQPLDALSNSSVALAPREINAETGAAVKPATPESFNAEPAVKPGAPKAQGANTETVSAMSDTQNASTPAGAAEPKE